MSGDNRYMIFILNMFTEFKNN